MGFILPNSEVPRRRLPPVSQHGLKAERWGMRAHGSLPVARQLANVAVRWSSWRRLRLVRSLAHPPASRSSALR